MIETNHTRRGNTQKTVVMIKKEIIPEFSSGPSTQAVTQGKQQAWKMLKQVQQLSHFIAAGGCTQNADVDRV